MDNIPELTKVKIKSYSSETGECLLVLQCLTPFPIEKYNDQDVYYVAIGETGPEEVPEFNA